MGGISGARELDTFPGPVTFRPVRGAVGPRPRLGSGARLRLRHFMAEEAPDEIRAAVHALLAR
ncbi:hypothetical protein GCM10020229_34900 [Kitasatospora albolonga]